ncbi:RloB family protein [Fulvivirga imtechensis]|uniref:RloB family protein n=1 Tax=Fulvivirga imtechensis TaxID=881893 RepID=UPI00058D353B|nr:RloB family protein [Fulvivirga imtechensis]
MASRRKPRGKRINPTFYVFCEGQTEEEYIKFLRSVYRIPIEINSKRTGNNISQRYIDSYLKTKTRHAKDQTFLMYDLDVDQTLDKLNNLDGILLVSNPCIELWFLLHHQDQRANISSASCIRTLCDLCPGYIKGRLSDNLKGRLIDAVDEALLRAKALNTFDNPSTTVSEFIVELELVRSSKKEGN